MGDEVEISRLAESEVPAARALVAEYVRSLGVDLGFQGIEAELADFPARYAEPEGAFLVARAGGAIVGCVGMKRLGEGVCEMKRLYVADAFKGRGVGRSLVAAVLGAARGKGYRIMRLDTLRDMNAALGLYRSCGFREIGSYVYNPLEGAVYMEKEL